MPDVIVKVDGYADPRGTESENLKLSSDRAEAVRAALMAGGIADSRIVVSAHGEDGVTTPEGDVDGYALNRRVVITLEGCERPGRAERHRSDNRPVTAPEFGVARSFALLDSPPTAA